ncbi:hypothetical protein TUM17556_27500 [Enterobacter asburiae]|uniref:ead/Ea22-like family protein n=1 Tax=Enterobacter asburiae TaxID=61645 RepID=UPI001E4138B2|nr:ead/Ea22-like family protein [Enterobacter asburiae]GJK30831.1 hypothetical protein TUM17556_27500 [Enterobacter asburiae]
MSNIDKQALRGLSVESPFYLAECCNCGEIMPSSKLRESRNYPDDDGECHCPHCNADDCDIADSGAVGSEGVTAWNYQQKRIEALLDELEAAEKRIDELEANNDSATEALLKARRRAVTLPTGYSVRPGHLINETERGVMIPKDNGPWLSRHDVEHALRVAGIRISGED